MIAMGLACAALVGPLFASAASVSLFQRLCDRQDALGSRLIRLLIDPEICHPTPPPTLDFTADPTAIDEGGSSTLEWTSTNATSCTASDGWSGAKDLSGNEVVTPDVTTTYTLTCTGINGEVTKSATVTVAPTPTLTLLKTLPNNSGGTATAAQFQAKIDGGNVPWGVAQPVSVGAHTASETTLAGYTASAWGTDCAADGTITLAGGENKTCTITNDDEQATVTVIKHVVNDNPTPGTATAADFSIVVQGVSQPGSESGVVYNVNPGSYVVAEILAPGYEGISLVGDCSSTIALGEHKTCTITNGDIAPAAGHLIVDKVTQPSGDTTEFTISASGSGTITGGGAGVVTDATSKDYEVTAGTYDVSETPPAGWILVSNTCEDVVVAAGATETCTITNAKLPTLTVVKVVVNDNGGTKQVTDFPLFIDGSPVTSWATTTVATGTRTVSETNQTGYTSTIGGDCAANGSITLAAGDVKICTITNDDIPPQVEGKLLITEVHYDLATSTPAQGDEPANEWVEIYNGTNSDINLSNYSIADASSTDALPDVVLPAGKFAVITASSTTASFYSIPADAIIAQLTNATVGNGLANTGDVVQLLDSGDVTIDAVSWGSNTEAFSPAVPLVAANFGHSIARIDKTVDNNTAADWEEKTTPTPGQ